MSLKMRKAFTLIELVVTVSILSIGIILILRSFLGANTALAFNKARIAGSRFLVEKMAEAEEKFKVPAALKEGSLSAEAVLDSGVKAKWEEETMFLDDEALKGKIYCTSIRVSWLESGRERDLSAASYFKAGK